MTEIPEHLLKRSRDRRAALGLGGDDGADSGDGGDKPAESGAATPATTETATPAAAAPKGPAARQAAASPAPPPPKPDSPVVAAAKRRARIPFWAMTALVLLPIWAVMYVRAVTVSEVQAANPMSIGHDEFLATCASCHGADGGGSGAGYQLSDGEVTLTFPHIEDQIRWVLYGTAQYQVAGIEIYGDPDRPGGAHVTGALGEMPPQAGSLTDVEVLGAVCETRYGFGGPNAPDVDEEPWASEFANWCADDAPVFDALDHGATLAALHEEDLVDHDGEPLEIIPIGDEPAPATSG